MTPNPARDRAILAAILALALALCLPVLNGPLWFDEIVTVETHLKLGWGAMLTDYSMNHHYLHNLAAKATMSLFGPEPWAIRLPALLFGLGAIAALWAIARRVAGVGVAHAAAVLLALGYHQIWFSTNARGYTGMEFFSLLALLFYLRGREANRAGDWIGLALALAALIFTHLTGAFFAVALGLAWLIGLARAAMAGHLARGQVRAPLAAFAGGAVLSVLLYLPILPSLVHTVRGVARTSAVDPMQEYQNPLWTAAEGLRTGIGGAGPFMAVATTGALLAAGLGLWALRRRAPVVGGVTGLHVALTILVLSLVGMRIWPRFFFTDIALGLLLITCGVAYACDGLGRLVGPRLAPALFPLAILVMAALSGLLAMRNYGAPKQDMASAVRLAEAARTSGTRVYAIAHSGEVFHRHFATDWQTIFTPEDYAAAMAEPGRLLVVVVFPDRSFRSLPQLEADRAAGRLRMLARLPGTLGDGTIYLFERPDGGAAAPATGGSGG